MRRLSGAAVSSMNLTGSTGELRATIHITRKATGKVETVELISAIDVQDAEKVRRMVAEINAQPKEHDNGRNA